MSHATRKSSLLKALLSFLGGCLLVPLLLLVWGGLNPLDQVQGASGTKVRDHSGSFTLSGDAARPMSPGRRVSLDLTITNRQSFAITVSHLQVKLGSISAPNDSPDQPCGMADFRIVQASTDLTISVGAGRSGTLNGFNLARASWPKVLMLNRPVNQDGCQGATLALDYTATGTQKRR